MVTGSGIKKPLTASAVAVIAADQSLTASEADMLLQSNIPSNKFYEVSLSKSKSNGGGDLKGAIQGRSQLHNNSANNTNSVSKSTNSLNSASKYWYEPTSPNKIASVPRGRSGFDSPVQAPRSVAKSRMPGFTMLSKNTQPMFEVPDHHKTYRRVVLPDGTLAILPV